MLSATSMKVIEESVRRIIAALGEDPDREGVRDTPKRVAKLYADVLDGRFCDPPKITTFGETSYNNIVQVRKVPFYAFCEHHMSVFYGTFSMGYVPAGKVIGLSKLVRIFRHYAKRLTIQERLTDEAVDHLMSTIDPKGAICHVSAEHTCMSLRGVKSPGALTHTVAYRGVFENDANMRETFIREATMQ